MKSAERRQWYQIRNEATDADTTPEVLIYGEIDSYWGVDAAQFARDLAQINASEITVRINSVGGDIFDGIAILNALRGHDATINVVVDGLAASIASVIAMAGDTVTMNRNSQMMVHNGWAVCCGDMNDMAKTAEMLAKTTTNLASIYAEKSGGTVDDWLAVMAEETWMTADEAVEAGLADSVIQADSDNTGDSWGGLAAASIKPSSRFKYAGRQAAPAPKIAARAQTPQPVEAEVTPRKEPSVASLNESSLKALGLDAEADDDAVNTAVASLVAAQQESTAPPEPTPEQLPAVAAKFGLTVVDKAAYDRTVADAARGAEAHAQLVREANERTIKDALTDGRIAPASADTWREQLEANAKGTKALLETLPKNVALPTAEIGYGKGNEDTSFDPELSNAFAKITHQELGKDA